MGITIRRAKEADAVSLAPRLREADRNECMAFTGMPPEIVLPMSIKAGGHNWAVEDEKGSVWALFGVDPVDGNKHLGIIWAVTSPDIWRHRREVVKLVPKWLKKLHRIRPLLGNHIDARNAVHIRWLKRMGFSFLRLHAEFGVERRPFYEFARLRS